MYKHDNTVSSEQFTVEELLTMFKAEAQSICKKPEDILSTAESTLRDFIKWHGEYVKIA